MGRGWGTYLRLFLCGFPVGGSVKNHRTIEFLSNVLEFFGDFLEFLGKIVEFSVKIYVYYRKITKFWTYLQFYV